MQTLGQEGIKKTLELHIEEYNIRTKSDTLHFTPENVFVSNALVIEILANVLALESQGYYLEEPADRRRHVAFLAQNLDEEADKLRNQLNAGQYKAQYLGVRGSQVEDLVAMSQYAERYQEEVLTLLKD